jgi:hypothetical protein
MKSTIFLSCGQKKATDEPAIAQEIKTRLEKLGFDVYIAVEQTTLKGVKESIFPNLERAEYFLFVDFKRENLGQDSHRGSVFCQQELALAAYLELGVLMFQEEGIIEREGLLGCMQSNSVPFRDRKSLAEKIQTTVEAKLNKGEWRSDWKNQLVLEKAEHEFIPAVRPGGLQGQYYHVSVRNLNPWKPSFQTTAYLEKVLMLPARIPIPLETIEFKWAGYTLPSAVIGAGQSRLFDAFWAPTQDLTNIQFNVFSDSSQYMPKLAGEGVYEMTYVVLSSKYPPTKRAFILSIQPNRIDFRPVPQETFGQKF